MCTSKTTPAPEWTDADHPDAGKIRVLTLHASADAELGNEALAFYLRPLTDLLLGNTSHSITLEQSNAESECRVSVEIREALKITRTPVAPDVVVDTDALEREAVAGKDEMAEKVAREARILTRLDSLRRILSDVLGPLKVQVNPVDHSDIFEALAAANERVGQCQQLVSAIATEIRP